MKPLTSLLLLFNLLFTGLNSEAQPQQIFMDQLIDIEFSKLAEIKGRFISEDANGDAYYICTKPLLGFTTMIMQNNGKGPMSVRAVANSIAPLPPNLEKVLDQLSGTAAVLGSIKKDSDTDGGLKEFLKKNPQIKRIVVFVEKNQTTSVSFYINHNNDYMIAITNSN